MISSVASLTIVYYFTMYYQCIIYLLYYSFEKNRKKNVFKVLPFRRNREYNK